ncbi:hypothetical protein SAMN04515674_11236 [Pseudarcicella hirudinis]|uniref:Uncharacterized protein n=1 Tax=Pseudarcicella hirudinis TaxID=1079859 RepID=A0A1I5WM33_9BACT|nr:hypothetical protein SAMN04515674_11236 [Pseudarcicella hirudinis]
MMNLDFSEKFIGCLKTSDIIIYAIITLLNNYSNLVIKYHDVMLPPGMGDFLLPMKLLLILLR